MKQEKLQNDQIFMLRDEEYNFSVMPSKRTEMWRHVELKGDVSINGGIFGKSLDLYPQNIYIKDAVFILEHIKTFGQETGKIWFNSVVNADHSFLTSNQKTQVRIGADLHAEKINITNCFIYGNVICDEAIIKDSVILGIVYSKNKLTIENSIVGSFQTANFILEKNAAMIFPFAISGNYPKINGELFYLFLASLEKNLQLDIFKAISDDIYETLRDDEQGTNFIISPNMRIFDFSNYLSVIQENLKILFKIFSSEGNKIPERDKELSAFEKNFFQLIQNEFKFKMHKTYSQFMKLNNEMIQQYFASFNENNAGEALEHVKQFIENQDEDTSYQIQQTAQSTKLFDSSAIEETSTQTEITGLEEDQQEMTGNELRCPHCKNIIENPDYKFCNKCGKQL